MSTYEITIFYSAEDDGYIAEIPDLEYCSALVRRPRMRWPQWSGRETRGLPRPARLVVRFRGRASTFAARGSAPAPRLANYSFV